RMMWSDKLASRARRWSDRAARLREWQASKIPECVRSSDNPLGKTEKTVVTAVSRHICRVGVYRTPSARQAAERVAQRRARQRSSSRNARSAAGVAPPAVVIRSRDMRWMPRPEMCARFDERVRELTPNQEISDDSRPYSIFGQRFITTL